MAGSASNFLELEVLDHIFKVGSYTPATNLYLAACEADPTDAGTGSTLTEPGGDYTRKLINNWDAASGRATANTNSVTFPVFTVSSTVTHWAICDDLTAGNMLFHGDLTSPISLVSGNRLRFSAGSVDITMAANGYFDYLANKILDHVLKVSAFTVPTSIYIAALSTAASDSETGSTITELSGNSYDRVLANSWDVAAAGATENTGSIDFPEPSGAWATVNGYAAVDASSAGNGLSHASLDTPASGIGVGAALSFADGAIDITQD